MMMSAKQYLSVFLVLIFLSGCVNTPPPVSSSGAPRIVYAPGLPVDRVVVKKSESKMYLKNGRYVVKAYDIAMGQNPIGHKVQEGDKRTPEGTYSLNYKNDQSKFYKSISISYPNPDDIYFAQMLGVSPGGSIVIHGAPNSMGNSRKPIYPKNWTDGCIAVRNHEMDEIWELVSLDTPIDILP